MEVMEARLIRAAEINGEVDDDDTGGSEALGAHGGLNSSPQTAPALACLPPGAGPRLQK